MKRGEEEREEERGEEERGRRREGKGGEGRVEERGDIVTNHILQKTHLT